jgi:hypothetical protein
MVIRVMNEFHNQDFTVIPNGNLTLTKYKAYVKRACSQKDCDCETKVYMKTNDREEADLIKNRQYWKRIDPTDLEFRDRGYGVKL